MHRINRNVLRSLTVLACAAIGGCVDPIKAPPAGEGDLLLIENYPRIVATDGLDQGLRFSHPIVDDSSETQPLRVTVPVRSVVDKHSVNIQYKFEFFDQGGRLLNDSGWRFENLSPRIGIQLQANALHIEARDWRLIVRSAR